MNRLFLVTVFVFFVGSLALYAEKAPVKFGSVSMEEMQMNVCDIDTSASAVVLCQYGYFNSERFQFIVVRRIKILRKEGVEFAEYSFRGDENSTIRGKTYNLVDGQIVEDKLKNESIFKERVFEDVYRIKIAMPNVKVGSVIDIETSQQGLPGEFRFQDMIPVKHAELVLEENQYIEYKKRVVGYVPFTSTANNRYVIDNIPAFQEEPFMSSVENFITKFEFDILRISFPGYYKSFTTSWESANKILRSYESFAGALTCSSGYLSDLEKEIEAKYYSPYDKAVAAYDAIKKIKWDGHETMYASTNMLGMQFKKGVGNSADINMMLYQLLQRLEINCAPVALSTRDNGILDLYRPSLEKLNYMVVAVYINDKKYVVDASEKYMPFGMLPFRALNYRGRVIDNGSGEWIELTTDKKDKQATTFNLSITDDLKLKGQVVLQRQEYAAFNSRKRIKEYANEDGYIESLEAKYPGLVIQSYKIDKLDSIYRDLTETYDVEYSNGVEKVNDLLMVNPFMFEQIVANHFTLETRQFPVDYGYNYQKSLVSIITIPDGYTISELPKPISFVNPDKTMSITLMHQFVNNNQVQSLFKVSTKKTLFTPEEYPYIKALYDEIIKKEAEPIILKKI